MKSTSQQVFLSHLFLHAIQRKSSKRAHGTCALAFSTVNTPLIYLVRIGREREGGGAVETPLTKDGEMCVNPSKPSRNPWLALDLRSARATSRGRNGRGLGGDRDLAVTRGRATALTCRQPYTHTLTSDSSCHADRHHYD